MTRIGRTVLALTAALSVAGTAYAIDPIEIPDPALQARYVGLTHELRCMQCQNQSIADSPVSLAGDLRREVREALIAGKSDAQIRDFMVARYGEFILFRPRFSARNAWLWLAPVALLGLGAFAAARVLRQRRTLLASDPDPIEDESPRA
ncbi:MAG: cytochrome c-type biogenesis protein [Steroidobacteraceae bacterium]